jgi:hypothetical protein
MDRPADRPYWDPQLETLPPDRRRLLREHRLHWQVRRCWDGSPFYRARLEAAGLDPASFAGLADWARLPILHASDLPATPDWAVAPEAWWDHVDQEAGVPDRVVTDGDAIQQADLAARALWAGGARPGRTVRLADDEISDLARTIVEAGAARVGLALGDAAARVELELVGPPVAPTLAYRCQEGESLHWNDDHFLIEFVDRRSGQPAAPGSAGAVIVTDLAREGSPLLRFWTDLEAALLDEPCACGRTSTRSSSVRRLA